MRRILPVGLVIACCAALLGNGINAAAAQSTSPATFTTQVCSAIATATQSVKSTSAGLEAAAKAYKATPSEATAVALRDALTQSAQSLDQQFANLLAAIQQAGTPANATDFVAALTSEIENQRALAQKLAANSAAVDTSSASTFAASFQKVLAEAKADSARSRTAAKKNVALKKAPKALRPIVRTFTTKADTCAKS